MQLTVIGPPYTGGVFVSPVPSLWDLPKSSVCLQGKARNPKSAPILNIKLDVHTYGHILTPFVCLRPGRVHIQSTVTSPGQQKKTSSSSSCWLCQQSLWPSVCWNCITWHGDTAVGRKCVCVSDNFYRTYYTHSRLPYSSTPTVFHCPLSVSSRRHISLDSFPHISFEGYLSPLTL